MFNLETAISEWRRRMLAAGIQTPVPMEELESHLREDIHQQIRQGMEARQAFAAAVGRIGEPGALLPEFGKIGRTKKLAVRAIITGVAIAVLILLYFLDRWHEYQTLALSCCLLGSLFLSLTARKHLLKYKQDSRQIVRTVWTGQICLGLYALFICSPYSPAATGFGALYGLFIAQFFRYVIRRRPELRELLALRYGSARNRL